MFAYPETMMRTFARLITLCLLLPLTWAARPALAQGTTTTTTTGSIPVLLLRVAGTDYNTVAKLPINAKACATPHLPLEFKLTLPGSSANQPFLQVWFGSSCNAANARVTTTTTTPCALLNTYTVASSDTVRNFTVNATGICAGGGTQQVWFLLTPTDTMTADAVTTYGEYDVKIDTNPPIAPSGVTSGTGETQIPVTWNAPNDDLYGYTILWDTNVTTTGGGAGTGGSTLDAAIVEADSGAVSKDGGIDGGVTGTVIPDQPGCTSQLLHGGAIIDLDHLPAGVGRSDLKGKASSTTLSADQLGGKIGTVAAIAVVAIDVAGNPSLLSNTACAEIVKTLGFWDVYKANGGNAEQGCACSAPGGRSTTTAAWPVMIAMLALGIRARRKRS
jgi:MYXO-CTERM domain-containing protein